MKNKTIIFLLVSIIFVLIRSFLLNTYSLVFMFFSVIFGLVIIYYAWVKGLKYLYTDFKNWFQKDVTFIGIFFIFLFFIIPFSSADKCLEDDGGEIFAGHIEYHCIEYNTEYKAKYTYINIFSYLIYLVIALYFYLIDKPKKIVDEKKEPNKVLKIKKIKKPNKKKKVLKTKKRRIKRKKSKRRKYKK